MNLARALLVCVGIAVLVEATIADPTKVEVVKSKADPRSYYRFHLQNGLDVLLVHDRLAAKAAASMDVGVGWWEDKPDLPGLSHFLEHMLFLGSKEFPKEDGWRTFLSKNGGHSNAFTSSMNTNFHWAVQHKKLDEALHRFSGFFANPLFNINSTLREINAVNAENSKNLQNDVWRTQQLLQSLSSPALPYHKFSTGNLKTLGTYPARVLHERLVALHRDNYVANKMRLTMVSAHSLPHMKAWVEKHFKAIPPSSDMNATMSSNNTVKPERMQFVDLSRIIYNSSVLGSIVDVQTIQNVKKLDLHWAIPPQTGEYEEKNIEFIRNLLGNEADGSLISNLKRRGLISDGLAGVRISSQAFDIFQLSFSLTTLGNTEHGVREIIGATMRYFRLIERQGIDLWRWQEMGRISAIRFRIQNKVVPYTYSSQLSRVMAKYKPRDILMAPYLYRVFNKQKILNLLKVFTADNLIAFKLSPEPIKGGRIERWYSTPYKVNLITSYDLTDYKQFRQMTGINSTNARQPRLAMKLPPANPYIPSSLAIKPESDPRWPYTFPVIIRNQQRSNGSIRTWFHQDIRFNRPRAKAYFKLWSPAMYSSPREVVMAIVYSSLIEKSLEETTYLARAAGYRINIMANVDGFEFRYAGFDSELERFVDQTSKVFRLKSLHDKHGHGFAVDPTLFALVLNELKTTYSNFGKGQPYNLARYDLSLLLANPHWHVDQYSLALEGLELEDVLAWSRGVFQDMSLECLISGNLDEFEANSIVQKFENNVPFASNIMFDGHLNRQTMRVVQLDGSYTFVQDARNKKDSNSAAFVYYQYPGKGTVEDDVNIEVLARFMSKHTFDQLRTKEALGYIVMSGVFKKEGVQGIRITVQSAVQPAGYLDTRITNLMEFTVRRAIHNLTEEHFNRFVKVLAATKFHVPSTLSALTNNFWSEISTQQYDFVRRHRQALALQGLTLAKFKAFYDDLIGWSKVPGKISVLIRPYSPENTNSTNGTPLVVTRPGQKAINNAVTAKAAILRNMHESEHISEHRNKAIMDDWGTLSPAQSLENDNIVLGRDDQAEEQSLLEVSAAPKTVTVPHYMPSGEHVIVQVQEEKCVGNSSCEDLYPAKDKNAKPLITTDYKGRPLHPVAPPLPPVAPQKPEYLYPEDVARLKLRKKNANFDNSCNKGGPRRTYRARSVTVRNVQAFKDGLCLFPKRPVGRKLMTRTSWLKLLQRLKDSRPALKEALAARWKVSGTNRKLGVQEHPHLIQDEKEVLWEQLANLEQQTAAEAFYGEVSSAPVSKDAATPTPINKHTVPHSAAKHAAHTVKESHDHAKHAPAPKHKLHKLKVHRSIKEASHRHAHLPSKRDHSTHKQLQNQMASDPALDDLVNGYANQELEAEERIDMDAE